MVPKCLMKRQWPKYHNQEFRCQRRKQEKRVRGNRLDVDLLDNEKPRERKFTKVVHHRHSGSKPMHHRRSGSEPTSKRVLKIVVLQSRNQRTVPVSTLLPAYDTPPTLGVGRSERRVAFRL